MSTPNFDPGEPESTIIVDAYHIKVQAKPGELGEQTPTTLREVLRQVGKHILRIIAAPTRLLAETLEGVTCVVRAVSRLPSSVTNRIEDAHKEADESEHRRQEMIATRTLPVTNVVAYSSNASSDSSNVAERAVDDIADVLRKYRAPGQDATIRVRPDGVIEITLGIPTRGAAHIVEAIENTKKIEKAKKPGKTGKTKKARIEKSDPEKPAFLRKIMD